MHDEDKAKVKVYERLDKLQESVDRIHRDVQTQRCDEIRHETMQRRSPQHAEATNGGSLDELRQVVDVRLKELNSTLSSKVDHMIVKVSRELRHIVSGDYDELLLSSVGAQPACLQSIEHLLRSSDATVRDMRDKLRLNENAQKELELSRAEIERMRACAEDAQSQAASLQERVEELKIKIDPVQCDFIKAEASRAQDVFQEIRNIEARGNIAVDCQYGVINLVRSLPFETRRISGSPKAALADKESSRCILDDVAAIFKLFDVEMEVEVHTKASEEKPFAYWKSLSEDQTALMKSLLVEAGIPACKVTAKSFAGDEGLNCNRIRIQLQRSLFANFGVSSPAIASPIPSSRVPSVRPPSAQPIASSPWPMR